MNTIFEALRKDHDTQRNLLERLVNTKGDSKSRATIFEELKRELDVHADGEERHFYKPLISNDMMQEKARHGIAEHHEIDELLEQLETTDYSSSAWLKIAKDLQKKVTHHLEEEEHTFFQLAGKVFTEEQKINLGKDYRKYVSENFE